jgi:hypothetical protein
MPERNLCHESGCPDLCCRDMTFVVSRESGQRTFPGAERVSFSDDLGAQPDGPYIVARYPEADVIRLKGACPSNNASGCSGPKMPACRNFPIGSKDCNKIRKANGISAVETDGTISPKKGFFESLFSR